jgi:hypothetical protein
MVKHLYFDPNLQGLISSIFHPSLAVKVEQMQQEDLATIYIHGRFEVADAITSRHMLNDFTKELMSNQC